MLSRISLGVAEVVFAEQCRAGRLATTGAAGRPRAVPVCYAFDADGAGGATRFFIALDEKPKSVDTRALGRVRDILARPEAALLIDRYEDDW